MKACVPAIDLSVLHALKIRDAGLHKYNSFLVTFDPWH
jgi:hypothetical protein